MPRCPLNDPQCTISSKTRPVCPMGHPNCGLNISVFPRARLVQELDRVNNTSLLSAVDTLGNDPELVNTITQLRVDIDSTLTEEEINLT